MRQSELTRKSAATTTIPTSVRSSTRRRSPASAIAPPTSGTKRSGMSAASAEQADHQPSSASGRRSGTAPRPLPIMPPIVEIAWPIQRFRKSRCRSGRVSTASAREQAARARPRRPLAVRLRRLHLVRHRRREATGGGRPAAPSEEPLGFGTAAPDSSSLRARRPRSPTSNRPARPLATRWARASSRCRFDAGAAHRREDRALGAGDDRILDALPPTRVGRRARLACRAAASAREVGSGTPRR